MKYILVTGGAGYIGIHVVVELLNNDYNVIILDDLSNSNNKIIEQIKKITDKTVLCYFVNILSDIDYIFKNHNISNVIHLAGVKSVSESILNPLKYYDINVGGLINLLKYMNINKCYNIIYSSSACVYAESNVPLTETSETIPCNPYGYSKLMGENILQQLPEFKSVILRYFNPIGCHPSGIILDNSIQNNTNLVPRIIDTLNDKYEYLTIYGDGTAVRDFIHVVDVAKAHIKLLDSNSIILNLGTGKGISVNTLIETLRLNSDKDLVIKYEKERLGDIKCYYSNVDKIHNTIDWKCEYDLNDMCQHSLLWCNK